MISADSGLFQTKQWHNKSYEFIGRLSHHWQDKKGTHWLVLEDHLYLGIKLDKQEQFKDILKKRLKTNENIIVRGKPYFHDKHWRIKLSHPWQIIRQHQITTKNQCYHICVSFSH